MIGSEICYKWNWIIGVELVGIGKSGRLFCVEVPLVMKTRDGLEV